MTQRPPSARQTSGSFSNRPRTSRGQRPPTGIGRKSSTDMDQPPPPPYGSISRAMVGGRPGSASRRLSTAQSGRPPSANLGRYDQSNVVVAQTRRLGTGASRPPPSRAGTIANSTQRPVTQQGLQGLRPSTGRGLQNRQIQDKSYYIGLLRSKISELTDEMSKLRIESEHHERERQNFSTYEKKAETLATEIKELQGEMSDLNMVIDRLNTNADPMELQQDYERNSDMKGKFDAAKEQNKLLIEELQAKQRELIELNRMKDALEDDIHDDQVKREAIFVQEKISELEAKKAALTNDMDTVGTFEERKNCLLDRVKKDNEEIASMERQLNELKEKIQQIREEMFELDDEIENQQNETNQKYRELRQKESQMDEFLDTYENEREVEQQRLVGLQKNIVNLLSIISKAIENSINSAVKDDSIVADEPSEILSAYFQSRKELVRLNDIECKYALELETVIRDVDTLREELSLFGNLENLDKESQATLRAYETDVETLTSQIVTVKNKKDEIESALTSLISETESNELYLQTLKNLWKKESEA
uniref:Uncharacterized protein n=1 Tax=Romanomermis culicivorax TaxID=13658 RepID=A0A915ISV7_ROMCU